MARCRVGSKINLFDESMRYPAPRSAPIGQCHLLRCKGIASMLHVRNYGTAIPLSFPSR
jgi:hypothetical protein